MISHFHLIYYNTVRWARSRKWQNAEFIAAKLTESVAIVWIFQIVLFTDIYFQTGLLESIDKYWWAWAIAIVCGYLAANAIIGGNIRNKCWDQEEKYNRIRDWGTSKYRKRALFYLLLHFMILPALTMYLIVYAIDQR